ncbi:hypothetical protein [Paraburkholderia sp. J63]|uniref:hypothetical protein n=1 Tax=Paraburkholderia sp. J63 TaxID=2805434 RepID=UPI002ABD8123|nr:hypothetical protein [Paraburkholderia sp. J63]
MRTTEFKFCTRGLKDQEARYSAIVVHHISVTFIRIGSQKRPFCLIVPRGSGDSVLHADAEDLARMAVAQSLRDGLFDVHPAEAIDLDVNGFRWDGDLTAGQWLHGSSVSQARRGGKDVSPVELEMEEAPG